MIKPSVISVSQLNKYVKSILESDHLLSGLLVKGEISNFVRHYKSGHLYFTLKDENAAVKAVMFRSYADSVPFQPENGMSVIVSGSVSLYERDGSYQFYVTDMQPDGAGSLHLAFEQIKEKLSREGLFDPQRKRPLPAFPERIGIVTSEGAAALQDMLHILSRRYPVATVVFYPAQVQGEGAAATVAAGIRALNVRKACDVIIIGRGGGSIEDLWAFNDESLARTIAASEIPVVSAVGHETDFTIADFAADLRAPTPSAAAELVAPNIKDLQVYLDDLQNRALSAMKNRLERLGLRIAAARSAMAVPQAAVLRQERKLEFLRLLIQNVMEQKLGTLSWTLRRLGDLVEERSPLWILKRGYSLTQSSGKIVSSVNQVCPGDLLSIRVTDGEICSSVVSCKEITE
ncbi:exodeoxyribonuclease VII large subunit [Marasmitruncus massiliensis]|uniref:exodeoxyribonuclease VII large subunit n=1 Tax=Marasmitruncus massiliensis TaxID=1944642 RepID=UPI000C7DE528|nr:exodeoxyribonuclease VII large subunit [Marasmitruncus massiliensis]